MGDVLLFPGQGSNAHFSDQETLNRTREDLGDTFRPVFDDFLRECRNAFIVELESLSSEERSILEELGDLATTFEDPDFLLRPPVQCQTHPVIETLTLYLRQILELILYQARRETSQTPVETTGVCTGILPAILAASYSSFSSPRFLTAAVHGFRLAFWIGLRVSLFCRNTVGDKWRDHAWALSIFGSSVEEVKDILNNHSTESPSAPRISAIFPRTISLTGRGPELEKLKSTIASKAPSAHYRSPHIHGYYHGGPEMTDVAEQVLQDVQRRGIRFPTWESLQVSVRSASTGGLMDANLVTNSTPISLLETALQSIFVEKATWKETWESLTKSLVGRLDKEPRDNFRIIGIGPSSNSLVNDEKIGLLPRQLTIIEQFSDYTRNNPADAIAIVGLSVNYPSGKGQEEFWNMLEKGVCTASKIPNSRFDVSQYRQAGDDGDKGGTKTKKRQLGTEHGNFLDDPFKFDAAYFNISPREAKCMDPQQRLLLHAAVEALEDAGYAPNSTPTFQKDTLGVYVGVATEDYIDNLRDEIDVYYSPGTLRAFLSGRISYALGLKGPSVVFDTACSSSLVALYHACRALQAGDCTAALAGGVNVISSPDMYLGLSRAHFLSPTGQCKAFDASADGYCRAEGCGLVVVKKLADAVREGDHIYGVIRGIGVNQCGTAKSITHPDSETQASLFEQVLNKSGCPPESISVVEAHGTGTQAGDFAEINSLQAVFGSRAPTNPLQLMSIKGNIGHAEAASGVAGLAKLLLMMEKQKIPPQASFKDLNPRLSTISNHNFIIPTRLTDWRPATAAKSPRRALLNNFGAAGSNAAIVLEEYLNDHRPMRRLKTQLPTRSSYLLCVSAKTPAALEKLRNEYISYIERNPELKVEDLCYTANARRNQEGHAHRLSVIGASVDELAQSLRKLAGSASQPTGGSRNATGPKKTFFVFSGQGGIHVGAGQELLTTSPHFRAAVDKCDEILGRNGFPPVSPYIANNGLWDEKKKPLVEQCACFVVEYGLAQLLLHWGIKPDVVAGHSIGEYAALVTAGVLKLEDALVFVATRACLMITKCAAGSSGMMACRLPSSDANRILASDPQLSDLSVACENSTEDSVVAGSLGALKQFGELCKAQNVRHKLLHVPYGFHSSAMDPILEDLTAHTCSLIPAASRRDTSIDVGLSSFGRLLYPDEEIKPDYFIQQTRNPVRFSKLAEKIADRIGRTNVTVVEIGPAPITLPMLKATFGGTGVTLLPTLRPTEAAWGALSSFLQAMFLQGLAIRWREVYHDASARFLWPFPHYPLAGSEYVIPYKEARMLAGDDGITKIKQLGPSFGFLSSSDGSPTATGGTSFKTPMTHPRLLKYIRAHAVGGVPLCPASVYMECALEALAIAEGASLTGAVYLEDIAFESPLVCPNDGSTGDVQLELSEKDGRRRFCFKSTGVHPHCTGDMELKAQKAVASFFTRKEAFVKRQKQSSFGMDSESRNSSNTFSSRTIYELIFPRVVAYTNPFLTLSRLRVSETGLEGCGRFKLDSSALDGNFVCPPAFIDTMLHAAGFVANTQVDPQTACICTKVERAILPAPGQIQYSEEEWEIYCSLVDIGDSIVADAFVLDSKQKIVSCVEGMFFKKLPLAAFKSRLSRSLQLPAKQIPSSLQQPVPKASAGFVREERSSVEKVEVSEKVPDIEGTMYAVLQEVCGAEADTQAATSLSQMGVDSLLFIELTEAIRGRFPQQSIPRHDLEGCVTVGDLIEVVVKAVGGSSVGIPTPGSQPEKRNSISTTSSSYESHDAKDSADSSSTPATPGIESEIEALFLDVCGLQLTESDKHAPLSSLGVDSLLSMELLDELRRRLGLSISNGHEAISGLTVLALEGLYAEKVAASRPVKLTHTPLPMQETVVRPTKAKSVFDDLNRHEFPAKLQEQTKGKPKSGLYLFHDGSGVCSMYRRMPNMNRNVYGIARTDLSLPNPEVQTMEQLAEWYIEQANLADKPNILLGGWSFGGVLAFEVSRQLRKRGNTVKGVVLIDSPVPIGHEPLPKQIIEYVVGSGDSDRKKNKSVAREQIEAMFGQHAGMLQQYNPEPVSSTADRVPCALLHCTRTMNTDQLCGIAYPWLSDDDARTKSIDGWERLLGRRLLVVDIDCNHFEVFDANNIEDVSSKLEWVCAILEGR